MEFDPVSFLLGFGSASAISYGLWRYREHIRNLQDVAGEQADSAREFLRRSADARYAQDVIAYLQRYHMLGSYASLSEILIEPHLLADREPIEVLDENSPEIFTFVIPRTHEFPELYASYHLAGMPLNEMVAGDPHVAILGNPGMGKSTILAALGLMALGEISFESLMDKSEQAVEQELEGLTEQEIAQRKLELRDIQLRAIEQMQIVQDREKGGLDEGASRATMPITDMFPIFLHIGDIDLDLNIYGIEVDPAEPVIRAFQQYASLVTAQAAPVLMYQHLARGDSLVLIDGFDDLSMEDRARVYPWLENFIAAYGRNRIIITGSVSGYDMLAHLGFTPIFIRPWSEYENQALVRRWVDLWPTIQVRQSGKRRVKVEEVEASLQRRLLVGNRNRTPLETTLKIFAGLKGEEREPGRRGWFERYVREFLPDEEYAPGILREVVTVMLDRGVLLKDEQITEIATKQLTDDAEQPVINIEQFTKSLFESGLLIRRAGNTYAFRHMMLMGYVGGESLIHDIPQRLSDVANNERWQMALAFASAGVGMKPAVYQKLSQPPDLLFSNLFEIARWLPEAPPDAPWRNEIMKRLSAALLASSQYLSLRERALGALIISGDNNVEVILRKAIRSSNANIRRMACIGLGALGSHNALGDLRPMLVDDDRSVQLAAGMALGAIGTEKALEVMVDGLLEGDQALRQVVAEALAGVPGEGHSILRDAIEHEDMGVRRAAVYGLARIRETWSLILLHRAMLEDAQWFVRQAAENSFARARTPEVVGPKAYPPVQQLPWLINWLAEHGHAMPEGDKAQLLLVRALQEAAPPLRVMAATAIAQLGLISGVKPLYAALMDRDESVRTAAFGALGALQLRITKPLPSIA